MVIHSHAGTPLVAADALGVAIVGIEPKVRSTARAAVMPCVPWPKGLGGWEADECTQDRLSYTLREQVKKGDPRDMANFCLFFLNHGESIVGPAARPQVDAATEPLSLRDYFADIVLKQLPSAEGMPRH